MPASIIVAGRSNAEVEGGSVLNSIYSVTHRTHLNILSPRTWVHFGSMAVYGELHRSRPSRSELDGRLPYQKEAKINFKSITLLSFLPRRRPGRGHWHWSKLATTNNSNNDKGMQRPTLQEIGVAHGPDVQWHSRSLAVSMRRKDDRDLQAIHAPVDLLSHALVVDRRW